MASLASRVEALEKRSSFKKTQHLWAYGYEHHFGEDKTPYRPSHTGALLHASNAFVRCEIGPYGSGKSTACVNEIIRMACEMPPCIDGVRRSRCVFIRNTYGELEGTTLKTWDNWFKDLGHVHDKVKPPYRHHTFNDGRGVVELECIFLALDKPDDIKKLKSAEYTFAYLNEACELPSAVLTHIKGRVGRYPSKTECKGEFRGRILMDTNPPDTDHWMYKIFEVDRPEDHIIFHQPAGLIEVDGKYETNPGAENIANLPKDYYLQMASGASREFVKVFCMGQYGAVIDGKPVYPDYNDDLHSIDDIKPIEGLPLSLGWDFGLTPACIITQQDAKGRVYYIREIVSEDMDLETFIINAVKPVLTREFSGFKIGDSTADPAGKRKADSDGSDCISILDKEGINTSPAFSNDPAVRQRAVHYFLNRMIEGKPALVVSRKGCPNLRKGFIGGYQFKRLQIGGEARYRDVPDKNQFSHIHDAAQYVAMRLKGDDLAKSNDFDPSEFYRKQGVWG